MQLRNLGGVRGNLLFEYVHDKVVNWFNVPQARFLDYSSDTCNTHLDLGSHTLIQNMHKWGHTTHRKRHTHANVHIQFSLAETYQSKRRSQSKKLLVAPNLTTQPTLYVHYDFYMSIYFASTIYIYIYSYLCTWFQPSSIFSQTMSNQCTSIHAISGCAALVVSTFSLFTPTMEIWTVSMFWNSVETTYQLHSQKKIAWN